MLNVQYKPIAFDNSSKKYALFSSTSTIYSYEEIIKRINSNYPSANIADLKRILDLYYQEVEKDLCDGCSISTPLYTVKPKMSGTVDELPKRFIYNHNKKEINITLTMQPSQKFIKKLRYAINYSYSKFKPKTIPQINEVYSANKSHVFSLTPASYIKITGKGLTINCKKLYSGIFLKNLHTQKYYRINEYIRIKNMSIECVIPPSIPEDNYILCARYEDSDGTVKESLYDQSIYIENSLPL